jgi:hypothetical protein
MRRFWIIGFILSCVGMGALNYTIGDALNFNVWELLAMDLGVAFIAIGNIIMGDNS